MRERIDLAFHIMDREYGVTRLLDPEGEFLEFKITCKFGGLNFLR